MACKLWTPGELAEYLGKSPRTLERWRHKGTGPDFVTINRNTVRYRDPAVEKYLAERERGTEVRAA